MGIIFFYFYFLKIPNIHTIPVYPAKRFYFTFNYSESSISTPFCFSTVVSVAAIKDIPPGNSKCRFMRNRGKHCFVYHCKELVPLMNTKTKFLQKIWPFVGLYALSVDVLSNFGLDRYFFDTYLDDLGVFCPKIQCSFVFYVRVHETCQCSKNKKEFSFWVHVTKNLK